MRTITAVATALALVSSPVLGQTTRTNPSASSTISRIPSSSSTSPASPCYSSTNPTSPCYSGTTAPSYTAITPDTSNTPRLSTTPYSSTTPTVSSPNEKTPRAPVHSFTADQARLQIAAKGYANISDLKKDSKGNWRGKAMKDGKPVDVILDFEGNTVAD